MKNPMTECPQFATCSAPICPLDVDRHKRIKLKGEDECGAYLATREAIAAKHPGLYPDGVMTHRERIRAERSAREKAKWANMTEEQRASLSSAFEKGREALRLRRGG